MSHNPMGFFLIAVLLAWFPACGFIGHWLTRDVKVVAEPRPKGDPVAPTPKHVHVLDLDRGEITVTDAGGVLARCAVAGCGEAVYVARNLAQLYVAEAFEVHR
jgi:hypothetical protein